MVRRAVLGLALFGMMGTAALGQTMLGARDVDGTQAGDFIAGQTYHIEFYLQNLTPLTPVPDNLAAIMNWQLDFEGFNPEDAALSYGKFTQKRAFPGGPVNREFWAFTPHPGEVSEFFPLGNLFPATGGPFVLVVEDPLPPDGIIGPDNRGSSRRLNAVGEPEPQPGPGWSTQAEGPTQVFFVSDFVTGELLDDVLLATFEITIDADGDNTNTILGGGGPLAQLEWVTTRDAGFDPLTKAKEPGFGQTVGGLIGQALVPEPATMALLVAGLGGGLVARRRRS